MNDLFDVNLDELSNETEKVDSGFGELEPGVYDMVINNIYLDETNSGAVFIALYLTDTKSNKKLNLNRFSVERMIKNKEGSTKMKNGRYFTGVIFLNKIAQMANKNINQLKPVELNVEIFGENKQVKVFKELVNTKITIGIRDIVSEWNDKVFVNKEIVNILNPSEKDKIEKLAKRIAKSPVKDTIKQKAPKEDFTVKENEELPF